MSGPDGAKPSWAPTAEQLRAYSGEGRVRPGENTHTSLEKARAADMPNLIVQGHHTLAVGVELLRAHLAEDPEGVTVAAKFISPVFVGAELAFEFEPVPEGDRTWRITARDEDRVALVADVEFGTRSDGAG